MDHKFGYSFRLIWHRQPWPGCPGIHFYPSFVFSSSMALPLDLAGSHNLGLEGKGKSLAKIDHRCSSNRAFGNLPHLCKVCQAALPVWQSFGVNFGDSLSVATLPAFASNSCSGRTLLPTRN